MKKIATILLPLFIACSSLDYSAEKNQINELIDSYTLLDEKVNKINLKESNQVLETYNTTIEEISNKLDPNKIPSIETINFINEFRSIKKTFKRVPTQKAFFKNSVKTNKKQLSSLVIDMDNNVFDKNEIEKILIQEQLAISELQKRHQDLTKTISTQLNKLDSLSLLINTQLFK